MFEPIGHDGQHCYGRTPGGTIFRRPVDSPAADGPHWRYLPGQRLPDGLTLGRRIVAAPAYAGSAPPVAVLTCSERDAIAGGWWESLPLPQRRALRARVLAAKGARLGPLMLAELCRRLAVELALAPPDGVRWPNIARRLLSRGFHVGAPPEERPAPPVDRTVPEGASARLAPLAKRLAAYAGKIADDSETHS